MEAKALEEELNCAVCLQMYQDPVALPCQHSFCLKCIEDVWTQAVDRDGFSCPQCHRKFNSKPSLERIIPTVTCDHCIDSQSPAVKTCLKCETSFCCFHLKPHLAKAVFKDHELVDPVADLTHRKCPEHEKILEFFCTDDGVCVCSSCGLIGRHKSHNLVSLHEAEASIKKELKSEVENLRRVQQNCSMKEQDLEKSEAEIKALTNELKGNLLKKFSERRKQLEEDEKCALKLIDEEELRVLSQIASCSGILNKAMAQIKLIDEEAHNLLQGDCLSLIQNSKELRSRVTDTQNVTYPEAPELTLNLSNLSQLLKKWMEESETYHLATGEVIRMYERKKGPADAVPARSLPHTQSNQASLLLVQTTRVRKMALIDCELCKLDVDIAAVQEIRLVDTGSMRVSNYTYYWHVAISECISFLYLSSDGGLVNILCAYASTLNANVLDKDQSYDSLHDILKYIPKAEKLFIWVISTQVSDRIKPMCLGHHGLGKMNDNGQQLLVLCAQNEFCITSTFLAGRTSPQGIMSALGAFLQLSVIDKLDAEPSSLELEKVIDSLANRKAPRKGGFPAELLKHNLMKAFDAISRAGLYKSLEKIGCPPKPFGLICLFMTTYIIRKGFTCILGQTASSTLSKLKVKTKIQDILIRDGEFLLVPTFADWSAPEIPDSRTPKRSISKELTSTEHQAASVVKDAAPEPGDYVQSQQKPSERHKLKPVYCEIELDFQLVFQCGLLCKAGDLDSNDVDLWCVGRQQCCRVTYLDFHAVSDEHVEAANKNHRPLSPARAMFEEQAATTGPANGDQKTNALKRLSRKSKGEVSRLTLDPKTANKHLILSDDLRSVMFSYQEQPYPINLERFESHTQILCSQSFCWGCHSWEVETDGNWWGIGIAYGSVQKIGNNSDLRKTTEAWCLHLCIGSLSACHNSKKMHLPLNSSIDRIRVKLDYDAGTVSFFQVTDTLAHI
ncbi:uncharacterized protein [Heterodontus francisci]|uniref:uncharacterized protein n=1 Tax=Heterodontus francisci TaxID=7792 RepID=UPI00355B4F5F